MLLEDLGPNRFIIFLFMIINSIILNSCSTSNIVSKTKVGAIAGIVQATENLEDGIKSNVVLLNTEFGCATGKDGKFLLLNVPVGVYKVRAGAMKFHKSEYHNVRIAEDSVTVLKFNMIPDILPVVPPILMWEEENKKMYELNDFIIEAKLFDLKW